MNARYASFECVSVADIADSRKRGQQVLSIVVEIEDKSALVTKDKNIQPLSGCHTKTATAAGPPLGTCHSAPSRGAFHGLAWRQRFGSRRAYASEELGHQDDRE